MDCGKLDIECQIRSATIAKNHNRILQHEQHKMIERTDEIDTANPVDAHDLSRLTNGGGKIAIKEAGDNSRRSKEVFEKQKQV